MSSNSTCTINTYLSEGHQIHCGNVRVPIRVLCDDVLLDVIHPNRARLRAADPRCRLDVMLSAMLEHAPDPLGQRYVALCLLGAHQRSEYAVVHLAKAWLDNLLLPILAISKAIKTESYLDGEAVELMGGNAEQFVLTPTVAYREKYHCAVTNAFDSVHAWKLLLQGRKEEIPRDVGQLHMAAAHIVPFLLNNFDVNANGGPLLVRDALSFSHLTYLRRQINAALTWDMLQSRTQIDFRTLDGSTINSPANTIYMTREEYDSFGSFSFYFDKEAYPDVPNKYKVRIYQPVTFGFSNGQGETVVQSPTLEHSSIEPPNPNYLKIHAAFAKVLNLCGAVVYGYRVECEAEMDGTSGPNGEMNFASKFLSELGIIA